MRSLLPLALLLVSAPALHAADAPTVWTVAPGPSSVEFTVRHLTFSRVKGRFKKFSGRVVTDPALSGDRFLSARVEVAIPVSSVTTGHRDRDKELQGEEFFWADKYPEMRFASRSVVATGERAYTIRGDLTLRGVTRPVELQAIFRGLEQTTDGLRADFEATGSLSRLDFGLRWNEYLDKGGAILAETVQIRLKVALLKQTAG